MDKQLLAEELVQRLKNWAGCGMPNELEGHICVIVHQLNTLRMINIQQAKKIKKLESAPDGSWLWVKLMEYCRKRGIGPATQNDLFAIAGEAHKANTI